MFPDENKHLLAFDLIYCCSVYDLFDGISYNKLNAKEKNLFLEKQKAAKEALAAYNKAVDDILFYIFCFRSASNAMISS